MKEYRTIFNQYFKRFDIRDKELLRLFHHSYRVAEYSKEIGKSLCLNEHDLWLCEFIGLFHDIGRFQQWKEYQTYRDRDSIDHGDLSCKILEEENILNGVNDDDKTIILKAIKHYNKYEIEDIYDERILLFCKIIRDADKLDILFEQGNSISEMERNLSEELLHQIYNKKTCLNKYVKTDVDRVIRHIGFLFDLNFLYSFKLLKEKNWVENIFNLLENYVEDKMSIEKLHEFINKYIEERIEC